MTRRTIRLAVVAFSLSCAVVEAGSMGPRRGPVFLRQLFPPSLIMRQQGDIALTPAQRQAISTAMADAQKAVLDVRWQLEEKTTALDKLLAADKVDEPAALAQADEVVKLEDALKRIRLGMLIRIKNVLTPAQQEALRKVQAEEPPERHGGGRGEDGMDSKGGEP